MAGDEARGNNNSIEKQKGKRWKGSERRKYPRLPSYILVGYTLMSGEKKRRHGNAIAANISGGGMYLQISDLMPSDLRGIKKEAIGELKLEFKLPFDNEQIAALSEIRWLKLIKSGVVGLGVKFLNIDVKDSGKIIRYVTSKFLEDRLEP